ncbi:MAG: AbiH family protein [Bacilli bacterium]
MIKKLFLIGNGFDLAHGFKTRYLDFMSWFYENDKKTFVSFNKLLLRNFLSENGYLYEDDWRYTRPINKIDIRINNMDTSLVKATIEYKLLEKCFEYELLEGYYGCEFELYLYALWESLEENMHYVFLDKEVEEAEIEKKCLLEILREEEYGEVIEEDLEYLHRPAQEYLNRLTNLADEFESNLLQWVEDVNETICLVENKIYFYENDSEYEKVNLLEDEFFGENNYIINFNYSKTIELLYDRKVCHIHGQDSINNLPIMGHTKDITTMYRYDDKEIILVEKFYKNLDSIIQSNHTFFEMLKDSNEIVVLGLGYNETDYPYFEKINSLIPTAKWNLYYYSDFDLQHAKEYVDNLKINNGNVSYISLKTDTPFTKIVGYEME